MPYVTITPRDGTFDVRPMPNEDAHALIEQGHDVVYIEQATYDAWIAHQNQHAVFVQLWYALRRVHRQA